MDPQGRGDAEISAEPDRQAVPQGSPTSGRKNQGEVSLRQLHGILLQSLTRTNPLIEGRIRPGPDQARGPP
jgi:hypothetical protein